MNWTGRIEKIVSVMLPLKPGCCLNERQTILRLRINKKDKIKREVKGLPDDAQKIFIEDLERRVGIVVIRPN